MPITVSIVEDSDKFRTTLARVLDRAEGFKCISHYSNAEDALKALPEDKPEVVLMDINLPGMNGVECVRQLKRVSGDFLNFCPDCSAACVALNIQMARRKKTFFQRVGETLRITPKS